MLALARDLPRAVRLQDEKKWFRFPAQLLHNKTVGIFGVGVIAEALAPKCKAFGMRVVGVSSAPRPAPGFDDMRSRDETAQSRRRFRLPRAADAAHRQHPQQRQCRCVRGDEAVEFSRSISRAAASSTSRLWSRRSRTSASPAPRSTCSRKSRCRPIIRSGRCTTSSSPRIRAASATSMSITRCR